MANTGDKSRVPVRRVILEVNNILCRAAASWTIRTKFLVGTSRIRTEVTNRFDRHCFLPVHTTSDLRRAQGLCPVADAGRGFHYRYHWPGDGLDGPDKASCDQKSVLMTNAAELNRAKL